MLNRRNCFIHVCIMGILVSCGYRFSGTGQLPNGIQKICVATLDNPTAQIGIETVLLNDLIYEFTRSGHRVVRSIADADAVLTGRIARLDIDTISRRNPQTSQEVRVTLALNLTLTDKSGRVLWEVHPISDNQSYEVVIGDKFATDHNQQLAIEVISKRLAQTVYNNLTADF